MTDTLGSLVKAVEMLINNLAEFDGRCTDPEFVDGVESALTAWRDDVMRRREESPWKGPFTVQANKSNVPGMEDCYDLWVADSTGTVFVIIDNMDDDKADAVCAALNRDMGFSPDGTDLIGGNDDGKR